MSKPTLVITSSLWRKCKHVVVLGLFADELREGKFEKYAEYDTIELPKDCICYNLCLNDSNRLSAIVASSRYSLYSLSLKNMNLKER